MSDHKGRQTAVLRDALDKVRTHPTSTLEALAITDPDAARALECRTRREQAAAVQSAADRAAARKIAGKI